MRQRRNHWFSLALAALACALATSLPGAAAKPNTNFIASAAALRERMATELQVTKPDFVVFVPTVTDTNVNDTGNEHFLVFDGPDGSLMAVWTQSSAESQPDQHIGRFDSFFHHTGWLHGIASDDLGQTWSKPQNIPVARSSNDNPDTNMPPNMLCWQKPLRLGQAGKYLAGFTRWTSTRWTSFAVRKNPTRDWISADARVEFMRFENVDASPPVQDLKISWFAANEKALAVPFPGHPEVSACQEPTLVKLPDGRLFCVMRTASGSPFWSVSADVGETWTQPRRLLRQDGGAPLLHPLSPCPIYDVGGSAAGSGRYALFIHNHDGHYQGYGPTDTGFHRRPIYLVAGRFRPGADQPVWFDEPKFFMDHNGVSLGKPGTNGRLDLALYSSFTVRQGKPVLWYPERKFFLLGRKITEFVAQ
ncbi:MAG: sialidase family protein [Verrucomicrobia bacterium]|nr:sialidase family protein [Verrucomicrobiota bacterium]